MGKDITDPTYIGPGKWDTLHREAANATTIPAQQEFCRFVRRMQSNFPCYECKAHFGEYIDRFPPEKVIGTTTSTPGGNKNLGVFMWTWNFHNAVNARLKKPVVDWNTALSMYDPYSSSGVCMGNCAAGTAGSTGGPKKNPLLVIVHK